MTKPLREERPSPAVATRTTQFDDLLLSVPRDVYEPAEDSFLLAECLRDRTPQTALDVGTGSGIAALVLARTGARVVATDRNLAAVETARSNARRNGLRVEAVACDLAAAVRGPFDLVAMNPPYLPPDGEAARGPYEHALTGGPSGAEVARRLVADLPRILSKNGRALLLTSSRGNEEAVLRDASEAGFSARSLGEERWFFERLTVWELLRVGGGRELTRSAP